MRTLRAACGVLAASVLLGACGASAGLIPQGSASLLHDDLSNIQAAFMTPDCSLAAAYIVKARADFNNLPANVEAKLATQLQRGISTLAADEHRQCHNSTSNTGSTGSATGSTSTTNTTGANGATGATGSTSSTSSSTTSSTSSSSTASTSTGVTGVTGPTCTSTTGGNGGTSACDGATAASGIGAAGSGIGAASPGAASTGN
jgi:hypothetical protein